MRAHPLSIASAASVTFHLAVLLALGLLYARSQLGETDTLPVLSLQVIAAEPGRREHDAATIRPQPPPLAVPEPETTIVETRDEAVQPSTLTERATRSAQPAADSLPASESLIERTAATPALESAVEAAPSVATASVMGETDAQPDPLPPVGRPQHTGPQADQAVPTTSGPSPTRVARVDAGVTRPPGERRSVEGRERRMLERQLEKWAHRIEKLAAEPSVRWKHRGREYEATFAPRPARDDTGFDEVVVTVSSEQDGERLSTEMVMRRLAFSQFGQFVHRWHPRVQLHDDVIDGRFHANSDVQLSYSRDVVPRFNGRVTIAGGRVDIISAKGFVSRDEMFRGGLQTGVRRISLPQRFVPFPGSSSVAVDETTVRVFERDTRIVFDADGGYSHAPLNAVDRTRRGQLTRPTQYLLGTGKAQLHVSGVVNGRVLVYSPERIVIEGDLRYADDPRRNRASDDYLGIVSDRSIEIAAARITGPGDLRVDAALYARRNFRVRDFRSGETALLHLYGSLTAGSLDATEPRYRTRVEFDKRLEQIRPPAFPVTDRYELYAWDGTWAAD